MNIRTFAAIELSQPVCERVRRYIEQLKSAVSECNASWSRVENIHLTVKFFGDIEQTKVERISTAASRTVNTSRPFEIRVTGTGSFPSLSQPRVLWIGIEDPKQQLANLQSRFEDECAAEGFAKEERAFRPHLTIARIRKPEGARRLAEVNKELGFEPMPLVVNELVMFRSELSSQGSKYSILSQHNLA
jgi:2'-5' RNA ligase